jgi:hypothetical protein
MGRLAAAGIGVRRLRGIAPQGSVNIDFEWGVRRGSLAGRQPLQDLLELYDDHHQNGTGRLLVCTKPAISRERTFAGEGPQLGRSAKTPYPCWPRG